MDCTRRFFIGGATAFGAFGGNRLLEAFGAALPDGAPDLTFGVVSDIHVRHASGGGWDNSTFRRALEWFRDQGADAVMVVGDMADNGMVDQLQAVAQAWDAVFPGDRAPDGRKVEKLFVYGNHDYHGYLYGGHAEKRHAKEAGAADFAAWSRDNVLRSDLAGWWKRIFHEDYSRFYRKEIRGYTFLGQHWDDGKGMETRYGGCAFGEELKGFLDAHGKTLDPKRPFFYFQHPHPKDTCYGPWAWGRDGGLVTRLLSPYPNAIALSGHSHYSLTDERSVWQGAFTSVGTSSLRYSGMPYDQRAPFGYENTEACGKDRQAHDAQKAMADFAAGDCRQGMLWRVYGDRILVQRREFVSGLSLGPDWVMPLESAEPRPFDFASRAKRAAAPEFPQGAALKVKRVKAKTRKAVETDAYELAFPAALARAEARPWEYEVSAQGGTGEAKAFHVMAEGFNHARRHPRATADMVCRIPADRLPAGLKSFSVVPLDCWWNRGAPLCAGAGRADGAPAVPKVVFDTDMVCDYDDVGALACLHALADEGKCEVLAMASCTRDNQSVAAVEILNAFYGRPEVPVGCAKEIGVVGVPENDPARRGHEKYARLAREYPQWVKHPNSNDAPDANEVYRRALAAAPDGSVVFCSVGFLTNLRRLLETEPDAISPLNGRDLVARKACALYAMAGAYPKGREYNVHNDAASAQAVFARWPTPIYVSDFHLGRDVYSGRGAAERKYGYPNPVHDIFARCLPSREATRRPGAWDRGEGGHCSWDELTVLAAVTGAETFFRVARGGLVVSAADGSNAWSETANAGGALQLDEARGFTRQRLGEILDELIARDPKCRRRDAQTK